ncbi:hypothetical protein [Streptomyces sp. NPDC056190]|uniref:hypothetical protein n=1 Tax=unclassified Streptomyces TaxID=2593676 RepID=UPI0035D805B1
MRWRPGDERHWFGSDPGRLLRFEAADGQSVTLGFKGATKKNFAPQVKGSTVVYRNAVPGAESVRGCAASRGTGAHWSRSDQVASSTLELDTSIMFGVDDAVHKGSQIWKARTGAHRLALPFTSHFKSEPVDCSTM